MRLTVVLAVAASACVASGAEPAPEMPMRYRADVPTVVAAAGQATARRFPDADTVTIDDRIHTAYEPDGSNVVWDDEWMKALTEKGRRSLASVTLDFDARYGDATIQCVEIVGTNGQIRTVDFARTMKVATDNSAMGSNIVDPMDRKVVCAVPGLAVGETRHVRFCRRQFKARMKGAWADVSALEYTAPILSTVISVDQPAGRPVVHAVVRHPFEKTCTRAPDEDLGQGRKLLKWIARDVPQAFAEPNMPPLSSCVQSLRLSTLPDWETVSRWYWSLCLPHMEKTTPAMTNTVAELVADCPTPLGKIRAIFRFVSQEIRYMGLTMEDDSPGYEPHDVDLTFGRRYGVCRDKAALLAALLRIAGFPAYPVLIHVGAKKDPDVPMPFFNHAITAVEDPGASGFILMDATDESTKDLLPAYLANKSYLVAHPAGKPLRTSPARSVMENLLTVVSEGSLSADGAILLTTRYAFDGINDTMMRPMLLKRTPDERRRTFETILRGVVPGAELLSWTVEPVDLRDTETRLTVKTVARLPEALLRGKTRDALHLPLITKSFSVVNSLLDENTSLEKRRFPLELPVTAGTDETLALTLGDSVGGPLCVPSPCAIGTNGYSFARTVVCTSGVLTASRRMLVDEVDFDAPSYQVLRGLRQETETAERESPLFARRENENAHVRIRRSETVVHFASPTSWVETNRVEKEILTYRGKKSSAELKFPYAPSVKAVELVSATVSNANGKVFAVTAKELNTMDCAWAASAPRYPSSRILVANLPGVEIGSVIRYVVVHTVTNAATAYAAQSYAGGTEPYGFESFEFHVPEGLPFRWREKGLRHTGTNGLYRWSWSNPERLPDEPSQPPIAKWRPTFSVSAADWASHGRALAGALANARAAGSGTTRRLGAELAKNCPTPQAKIGAVRKYLATHLRTAGPGLAELPFDRAFSPPDRALADSYASKADRMNVCFALLEGAGFDCSFVLSAEDARGYRETPERRRAVPRPASWDSLVIRATWTEGRIPFFRTMRTFWLAGENEYTPPEASSSLGSSFYDLESDRFGVIGEGTDAAWYAREKRHCRISLRENGAADFDVSNLTWGAGVGGFRKRFEEMLPEKRSRYHQQLVGRIAQNATATSELTTDTESYPAELAFSAYVDAYAQIDGDVMTVRIPDFDEALFSLGGPLRKSPISIGGRNENVDVYEIVFPEGWTAVERLPDAFTLRNPLDAAEIWLEHEVTSRVEGERLVVTVTRRSRRERATMLSPDYFAFLKDWNRRAASFACRTVVVRRN
ncbi:MAG: DUF3857 domain-containing protein [Kiritimatiellia bacterium]